MLALSEIAAVKVTVDDRWCSDVADSVGERWGLASGSLRWWRSSATHVFVVPPGADTRGVMYARFAPRATAAGDRLAAGTAVHERLAAREAAVATLVRSRRGDIVEHVHTSVGDMVAVMVLRVEGTELDVDDLDTTTAACWGRALADLHRTAGPARRHTMRAFAGLKRHPDAEVAEAARSLDVLQGRTDDGPFVVGHGDFELDNLRWHGGRFSCFDFDESGPMPLVMDIAAATRDLFDGPAGRAGLLASFLDGYREGSGRTIQPESLHLPRAMVAARQLIAAARVIDRTDREDAELVTLGERLQRHYAAQQRLLIETAHELRSPSSV
ncbi:phosphotransferase [Ruania suaedae]|uniref:phosphotransferase enzyme family protein n=1 Tax=Ruania suaedae TaxID=2897774 RepID=UPI001E46630E|nr:phosphotransferase [Ruania suaedae]UFU03074.1 phosphotransferase [Ruania suaedae]